MKKILLLFLVTVLCFSLCSCDTLLQKAKSMITGEEISEMPEDYLTTLENDQFVYELYESYVKITEYKAEATEVVIPSEIDGKPVSVIGSLCFFETAAVTSVTIPDSVKTIEASAFYYAEALVSITIPDSVETIGMRAFAWCNALESVQLSANLTEIPDYCFNHCIALTSVEIPAKVRKIGARAFSYCEKLTEQTISATVETVGDRAFVDCSALKYVTFENPTVSLGKDIFAETKDVVVLAAENSNAYNYCAENGLRWSTSKDIEAVRLEKPETSEASDSTETVSQ